MPYDFDPASHHLQKDRAKRALFLFVIQAIKKRHPS